MYEIRKLFCCIVLFSVLCFLAGCGRQESEAVVNSIDGLEMSVCEGTVTPGEATVEIMNQTDDTYGFSAEFFLEELVGGKWYAVEPPDGAVWGQDDWLRPVAAGETETYTYTWDWYYGRLPSGEYRILVNVWRQDEDDQAADSVTLAAEFSLSGSDEKEAGL